MTGLKRGTVMLAAQFADDRGRYTAGKQKLIDRLLKEAHAWRSGT